jgi:hypothetical protein
MFIRYDPDALARPSTDVNADADAHKPDTARAGAYVDAGGRNDQEGYERRQETNQKQKQREFLFFGDVESEWRQNGEEGFNAEGAKRAGDMCREIWAEAAGSWDEGRLAGVFVSIYSTRAGRPVERRRHMMRGIEG